MSAARNVHVMQSHQREITTASSDEELFGKVLMQAPDLIVVASATAAVTEVSPLQPFQIELARIGMFIPTLSIAATPLGLAEHIRLTKVFQTITRDELSHRILTPWTQHFRFQEGELGRLLLYKADAGWGILSVLGRTDPLYFHEPDLDAPVPGELFRIGKVETTHSGGRATGLVRVRDFLLDDRSHSEAASRPGAA